MTNSSTVTISELRSRKTLYNELKIVDQRVTCIRLVSDETLPGVQGSSFSPGCSRRQMGTSVTTPISIEIASMATVKL